MAPVLQIDWNIFPSGFLKTPGQIAFFAAIIIVLFGGLLAFFIIQTKAQIKLRKEQAERMYALALKRLGPNPAEMSLIEKMIALLPREDMKYELLTKPAVFKQVEKLVLQKYPNLKDDVVALRIRLKFVATAEGKQIAGTAELPQNLILTFEMPNVRKFRGIVLETTPKEVRVKIEQKAVPPGPGTALKASFVRKEGVYSFETTVTSLEKSVIGLAHRENITVMQRRKYFRRAVNKEIQVRVGGSYKNFLQTTMLEISGGGCTIVNPDEFFKVGDDVEIVMRTNPPLKLLGEVLRVDKQGEKTLAHLSFPTIKETLRDKLVGFVLKS